MTGVQSTSPVSGMALKMGSNSVGYTGQKALLELPFLEINFYPTVKLLLIYSRVFRTMLHPVHVSLHIRFSLHLRWLFKNGESWLLLHLILV